MRLTASIWMEASSSMKRHVAGVRLPGREQTAGEAARSAEVLIGNDGDAVAVLDRRRTGRCRRSPCGCARAVLEPARNRRKRSAVDATSASRRKVVTESIRSGVLRGVSVVAQAKSSSRPSSSAVSFEEQHGIRTRLLRRGRTGWRNSPSSVTTSLNSWCVERFRQATRMDSRKRP